MTLREEIIEILKNRKMSLKEIYAHFPNHKEPVIRGVLNKGVAAGIFTRAGRGIYALPSGNTKVEDKDIKRVKACGEPRREKVKKETAERKTQKETTARAAKTSEKAAKNTIQNPEASDTNVESSIKSSVRVKEKRDYISALIDSVDKFYAVKEEEKEQQKKKKGFEEVRERLLSKGYRRADIELKVKDILVNDGTTAGVGKLEEELRAEYRLPDELIEKAPSPGKESLLKCPSNGKYWDLKLLRRTLNDAGISFNRKTRRNLRFEVDENLLYAFTEAWDFAVVLAEAVPDSLEGRIVYALKGGENER